MRKITVICLCAILMVSVFGAIIPTNTSAYTTHNPIYINGNEDFTAENGVTDGDGSESNPYVIEGWDIDASSANGIEIRNTDAYFIIRNCYVHDGWSSHNGIRFYNVQNGWIENTSLLSNWFGISLPHSNNNIIHNNNASNNIGHGISLYDSSNNSISNNSANSNGWCGISLCYHSRKNNISNNNASNNDCGIYLYRYSSNNNVIDNNISNNREGIYMHSSSHNTLINNTLENNGISIWGYGIEYYNTHMIDTTNTANGKPIYYYNNQNGVNIDGWSAGQVILANCTNFTIKNIDCSNVNVGVKLAYCDFCSVENSIFNNEQFGIFLVFSNNNTISNNNANSNDYCGILLDSSNNNTISNNNANSNNDQGICLYSSSDNTISNNNASNNHDGIFLWDSSNTNAFNNIISSNHWCGVYSKSYCKSIIRDNEIKNNWAGVWLESSIDSIIEGNTISNNFCGIFMSCSKNKIFHNNFVDNTIQAFDKKSNQWDDGYPNGGNYWSDYTGPDDDGDGIGDIPYDILGGVNQDNYPLMSSWKKPKGPKISVEKEFIPSEITTTTQGVISAINITNIGDVDITSMKITDKYVENMAYNETIGVLVTITSDEGEVYAIMPWNLTITHTDSDITISFDLPLEVVQVFWEDGKLRFGEELYYLESIPNDWTVSVAYLLYPITELEIGTYYADAAVTAYCETGASATETATGTLTVSLPIELAFPTI